MARNLFIYIFFIYLYLYNVLFVYLRRCSGSFYGSQCEIDGEVLSVAVGSSVAAISIIVLTLVCLCAWSRRWNKEQKVGSPVFGYMPTGGSTVKTPVIGGPPYQVSIEDRMRWAQIADAMAHANHYAVSTYYYIHKSRLHAVVKCALRSAFICT